MVAFMICHGITFVVSFRASVDVYSPRYLVRITTMSIWRVGVGMDDTVCSCLPRLLKEVTKDSFGCLIKVERADRCLHIELKIFMPTCNVPMCSRSPYLRLIT
jgi:hypothetical protein